MSFKCSVFGHRYGDPEVERDREEQGSEVVITITETETCKRCGDARVVSENKEVTTLETPSDIVGDDIADEEASPQQTADASATAEDAQLIDEAEDSPAEQPSDPQPASREQEAVDAEAPEEEDAVILEEEPEGSDDEGREPGEWPDEEDDDEDDWAPETGGDLRPVEEEQPDVEPTGNAVTVPDGEFHCPECGFSTPVESSSLREGDFCPECHRGSLTHTSEEE